MNYVCVRACVRACVFDIYVGLHRLNFCLHFSAEDRVLRELSHHGKGWGKPEAVVLRKLVDRDGVGARCVTYVCLSVSAHPSCRQKTFLTEELLRSEDNNAPQ